MKAPIPHDEHERLRALRAFEILDSVPEQSYDDITLLASEICGTSIAAISLVDEDRQWFKSIVGLDARETPRDVAFCAHAILDKNTVLQVPDATQDPRFSDNPLVLSEPRIRFYAGTPLVTFGGEALGTLCVIDPRVRELTPGQLHALRVLGRQVVFQLELRRAVSELGDTVRNLRDAEIQLRSEQARQMALKDQLISHVSHELRSPLTAIYQFVSILRDGIGGEVNDQQREYLDVTLKNVRQLKRMIGDLLDATRARTGKLSVDRRRVSLASIVGDVTTSLESAAHERGIRLTASLPGTLPDVVGDPGRLRQVIENLVGNALKFTPGGGSVEVRAMPDPADDGRVRVSVRDTGCGLAPEDHERVFDQLYQVGDGGAQSREGLGLGLAISRELVQRHDGRLWVESAPGRGSTFHFTVPQFDVRGLIAPVLTPRNRERGSVALIQVHLHLREAGMRRAAPGDPVGAALRTVSACTNPSLDVVLPRLSTRVRDTFPIVAVADEQGAGILVERIREQLGRCTECPGELYAWEIETTFIALSQGNAPFDPESLAASIAEVLDPGSEGASGRRAA